MVLMLYYLFIFTLQVTKNPKQDMASLSRNSLLGMRPPNASPYIFYIKLIIFKNQNKSVPGASHFPETFHSKDLLIYNSKSLKNRGVM